MRLGLCKAASTTALVNNWKGYREIHIEADWLLIYRIERNELQLVLTRTGSHDQLY